MLIKKAVRGIEFQTPLKLNNLLSVCIRNTTRLCKDYARFCKKKNKDFLKLHDLFLKCLDFEISSLRPLHFGVKN